MKLRILLLIFLTLLIPMKTKALEIDHISLITTPIYLLQGNDTVSSGTGFYYHYEKNDKNIIFLITNYHVLTGNPPQTGNPPKGDNIKFYIHKNAENPGDVQEIRWPLFTKQGVPIWLEPKNHPDADIVAIPILPSFYAGTNIKAISEKSTVSDLRIGPASAVTLVGYPYGFFDKKNWLPIWKTGSIATEPTLDFEGKPLILIDISAFPGMSGAPAFAIAKGVYPTAEGNKVGWVNMFLGIYASMQMLHEAKYLEEMVHQDIGKKGIVISSSLELGHIWKASILVDMLKDFDADKYFEEILKNL